MSEIVLSVRENDMMLLRSLPGVTLTVLQYDEADDLVRSDMDERELEQIIDYDASGDPYVCRDAVLSCAICRADIAADEPRVGYGTGHDAASFCVSCATEQVLSGDERIDLKQALSENEVEQRALIARLTALTTERARLADALALVQARA